MLGVLIIGLCCWLLGMSSYVAPILLVYMTGHQGWVALYILTFPLGFWFHFIANEAFLEVLNGID